MQVVPDACSGNDPLYSALEEMGLKASSWIWMHLSFCHHCWFCPPWGQVMLIPESSKSRDLCIQGMTLDLIGLIQKWKSCKKPTIGRKWQASIQVTLWCITYRDSMATPLWLFYMSLWLWVRLKCLFLHDVQCPCPRYKMLVRQWYGEAGLKTEGNKPREWVVPSC